jgi:hypothetical protein
MEVESNNEEDHMLEADDASTKSDATPTPTKKGETKYLRRSPG